MVVRYDAASGPWTAQVLIDAPDMNSIDEQHRATVTALAERSDVLVVVLHHQSVLEEASVSFVDAFAGRRHLLFVAQPHRRADAGGARRAARPGAPARRRRAGARRRRRCSRISARAAQTQPRAEGWAAFCRALQELVRDSAITGVRRLNALGTAARLGDPVRGGARRRRPTISPRCRSTPRSGSTRSASAAPPTSPSASALRRADLCALLCGEAAKRWDGPGGWALRSRRARLARPRRRRGDRGAQSAARGRHRRRRAGGRPGAARAARPARRRRRGTAAERAASSPPGTARRCRRRACAPPA